MEKLNKYKKLISYVFVMLFVVSIFFSQTVIVKATENIPIPSFDINVGTADTPEEMNRSLQILIVMTLVMLSPYLLIMMTCFTRITISLHFLRAAMGTMQMPPNQVLLGLALFLTLFMMGPQITEIKTEAYEPYMRGEMTQREALETAMLPIREFMLRQTDLTDLELFSELANLEPFESEEDIVENLPNSVLIPAFMLGEVTKGFQIGVILYIPFIVIDMVVASTLMAMGMMMLPPAMISLPFKILFFVMIDGWELVIQGVLLTFK